MRQITVGILLVLSLLVTISNANNEKISFKSVYNGQQEANLPKSLTKSSIYYSGLHDDNYFKITVMGGIVRGFEVIYMGEMTDRTIVHKKVLLSEALREHSMRYSPHPTLGIARGKNNQAWGIVDTINAISYSVSSPFSHNPIVTKVNYLLPDAPVLETPKRDQLSLQQIKEILTTPDNLKHIAENDKKITVIKKEQRYTYTTRQSATEALIETADTAIGSGRRTLALIDSAEIWLGVDEHHEKAKEIFAKLRKYHLEFRSNMITIYYIKKYNKNLLRKEDIIITTKISNLEEKIESRMRQVSAMGFQDY